MAEKKTEQPKKKELDEMNPAEKIYEEKPRTNIKAMIGEAGATVKDGVLSGLKRPSPSAT